MRKYAIIGAIIFQAAVLAFMAGHREYIVRTGKTIFLRTAPIDPRDIFRGDYVRLRYDISTIPLDNFKGDIDKLRKSFGVKIYTALSLDSNKVGYFKFAADKKPENEIFIRGRTSGKWRLSRHAATINVKYGIEAYFVKQGMGLVMEKIRRGGKQRIQVPLEMEIALSENGTGIIKGHRWSSLGVGLEILRQPKQGETKSIKIRLILKNVTDRPLGIVNLPDFASFRLESVKSSLKKPVLANPPDILPAPEEKDVIILSPEEKASFDFDFSDKRWWMVEEKFLDKSKTKAKEIGMFGRWERFRIVYFPPSEKACAGLKSKDIIWHGIIKSRSFNGLGNID